MHKKCDGVLCQGIAARYAFMKRWRADFPIALMCRALRVSRSGCYDWLERAPSAGACEDLRLKVAMRAADAQLKWPLNLRQ